MGGRYLNNCWLLRPGHMRKFLLLIAFRKNCSVGPKQHPWRYWISSVSFLSLVMIVRAQCLTGLDMDIPHKPNVLFLCPFKISVLPLIILISFLSNMAIQSSSHSWPKEINEELCNPSICAPFLHGRLEFLIGGCSLFLSHSLSRYLEVGLLVHPWCYLNLWVLTCLQFSSNIFMRHFQLLQLSLHVAVVLQYIYIIIQTYYMFYFLIH